MQYNKQDFFLLRQRKTVAMVIKLFCYSILYEKCFRSARKPMLQQRHVAR